MSACTVIQPDGSVCGRRTSSVHLCGGRTCHRCRWSHEDCPECRAIIQADEIERYRALPTPTVGDLCRALAHLPQGDAAVTALTLLNPETP